MRTEEQQRGPLNQESGVPIVQQFQNKRDNLHQLGGLLSGF